jgi:hypothetical protein
MPTINVYPERPSAAAGPRAGAGSVVSSRFCRKSPSVLSARRRGPAIKDRICRRPVLSRDERAERVQRAKALAAERRAGLPA